MKRLWNEIKHHRFSAALFLIYWLIVFGLDAFRWHKPANRPDMLPSVMYLHSLLPVIAGAIVSRWRRSKPGGITGAMVAGAAVLVLDAAAVLTWHFFGFRYLESSSNESAFKVPVLVIALGVLGTVLGLIGAAAAIALGTVLHRWRRPAATRVSLCPDQLGEGDGDAAVETRLGGPESVILRRLLRVAAILAWGAAIAVLVGVIPPLTADNIARTAPRAIPAFAVNAILNVLIGVALLASVSRRSPDARIVLVVHGGLCSSISGLRVTRRSFCTSSSLAGKARGGARQPNRRGGRPRSGCSGAACGIPVASKELRRSVVGYLSSDAPGNCICPVAT